MKKIALIIIFAMVGGAVAGVVTGSLGRQIGRHQGYNAALRNVGEYLLTEDGPSPWIGQGDAGFPLCLSQSEGKNVPAAAAQCLQEVQQAAEEGSAEVEEQTEAEKILEEMQYPPPGNGGR